MNLPRDLLATLLLLAACAEAPPPTAPEPLTLPAPPTLAAAPAPPDALARWNTGHVTAVDVRDELARQPEGTRPRQVVEALVDLDVVASAAAREGYWTHARVGVPWTRVLVKTLLKERFELDYDVSRVPAGDLARIWDEHKDVRIKFDHFDALEVGDVQYLCCTKRYTDCDPDATAACIEKSRPVVEAIFDRHFAGREHNEFSLKYLAEKVLQPNDPRVAFMRYSFYYDPSLPWEAQKKFHTYNRAIVEAAAGMQVGTVGRPVASNNGLHILYLMRHDPAVHRDLTDPEVEATVREKVLPGYRQRDLAILMDELMLKTGMRLRDEVVAGLPLGLRR